GLVAYQGSPWPTVAVGAPNSALGSGAVYFSQFQRDTTTTASLPREISLGKVAGVSGAKLGTSVGAVGNWEKPILLDVSNEAGIACPGRNRLAQQKQRLLYNVPRAAPVSEPLPPFDDCTSCDQGTAVAGNPRAIRDSDNRAERRLFAVGSPSSVGTLG